MMPEGTDSLRKGEKATIVSAAMSTGLAVMKTAAGMLTGSVVLMTSALDSFTDLMGMLVTWFGFRISGRKPDGRFPYGYYKAESVATLLVSVLIIYAAYRLALEGYGRLFLQPPIAMPAIGIAALLISIAVSFVISRYLRAAGRSINSDLLITCSRERMTDIASTSAVLAAFAMAYAGIPYAEGAVTIAISVLILKVGLSAARDATYALMDMSPGGKRGRETARIIEGTPGVEAAEGIRMRKSGPFVFGEAVIKVRRSTTVGKAHEIADEIEKRIRKSMSNLISFTVHVEPYIDGERSPRSRGRAKGGPRGRKARAGGGR
jgi:cation diffusion facilitator family transporter